MDPVPSSEGPFLASILKIPHTYCWSAALVPKPTDWASHIGEDELIMFELMLTNLRCLWFLLSGPTGVHTSPPDLAEFLTSGPPPIYIGFGSIVIDDSARLTAIVFEAIEISGVRALISRGWSKIGESSSTDKGFYLGDCPYEWLFQRVSAVIHYGGAGTTACGLLNARPTVIVPFFGDQTFWGQMIANAKAGPEPIPYKELNSNRLADGITLCLMGETVNAAKDIANKMRDERGVQQAVASFHRQLPKEWMGCEITPQQPAIWLYTECKCPVRLSNSSVENLCLAQDIKLKRKYMKQ